MNTLELPWQETAARPPEEERPYIGWWTASPAYWRVFHARGGKYFDTCGVKLEPPSHYCEVTAPGAAAASGAGEAGEMIPCPICTKGKK